MVLRFIPFGPYQPDLAAYQSGASSTALNVIPQGRVGQGVRYQPFPAFASYSNALSARCQGAFSTTTSDDDVYIFAGDENNLYQLVAGTTTWANVNGSAAPYGTSSEDWWNFVAWSSQQVIATNFAAPVQQFTIGSSSVFANLITSGVSVKAKFAATVRDFLVLAFTNDPTDGIMEQRVWWSAIGQPTNFPTPGSNTAVELLSDYQDVVGIQGRLTGIFPLVGYNDAVVVFERAIYSMNFAGAPVIFDFAPISGTVGSYSPKSIVAVNNVLYFYSPEGGFTKFDGQNTIPIGLDRVDQKIQAELNPSYLDRIVASSDPAHKTVTWAYPGPNSSNGIPDTLLIYHYGLDLWSTASPGPVEYLMRAATFGYTLEGLGTIYSEFEDIPYPLDSPVWGSNNVWLAGFQNQMFGFFDGSAMTPTVETPLVNMGEGDLPADQRGMVIMARPIFGGANTAATVAVGYAETLNSNLTYTTPIATNSIGSCPMRASGRYFTGQVSTTNPVWDSLVGVELDIRPAGRR